MDNAKVFFEDFLGCSADDFWILPQSGSARTNYIGVSGGQKYVITQNQNPRENEAFFYFSEIFSKKNTNTPKILKINQKRNIYIQEFLGEKTLSEIISDEGHSDRVKELVSKTIEKLFDLQEKFCNGVDYSKSYEYEEYNSLVITHDLYYFKNFLVDVLEIPYHKGKLLEEFQVITNMISELYPKTIMLRDFQARNILVNEKDDVFFIDYQSAMKGIAMYDVVSFLYQAKANFPEKWREEMIEKYVFLWDKDKQQKLYEALPYCKLIRFLQVLGAYGFRGIIQRKPHFLASLRQGIENIYNFFSTWEEGTKFSELKKIIENLHNFKLENLDN